MAEFQNTLQINFQETIKLIIESQAQNIIIKLRSLWFLAKVSKHKKTFKEN
jgi:hypothetical protein